MTASEREHKQIGDLPMLGDISPIIAAAHELKSPLVLMRQLSLLLEDEGLSDSERSRMIQQISLTSERALRLTSDLTRASRLDDTLFALEPINPQQLCEDIIYELTPLFRAHGRSLKLSGRKHPLLLVANRELLRRIIMNFSDNALHYAGEDRAVHLQVSALNRGAFIRLGVRDYGPALSTDMWRSLQQKLATAPQSLHARPQSSGLGLYIASQFAQAMQATIGVIRHKDGATFYVDLHASNQLSLL